MCSNESGGGDVHGSVSGGRGGVRNEHSVEIEILKVDT